ncbi:cornifelin homolog B-like [Engraulis encrasicolus]|uniref:cornifelin homolog B-like n=1 Tax=Engraulis encrasicolus TaxID=184585 RepID=UPI002FD15155
MANTMVVSQPVAMQSTVLSNQWSTGIFDCLDDLPSCCFSYWCFWCAACQTSRDYGEALCLPLVDLFGLGGCVPAIAMAMRADMRHRYGIQGSLMEDFGYAYILPACVYCQMYREVKARQAQVQPVILIVPNNPPPPAAPALQASAPPPPATPPPQYPNYEAFPPSLP